MDLSKLSNEELLALAQQGAARPPSGPGLTADNAVRQIAKGVPFLGSYMDELSAAGDAATYPLLGRGDPGETYSDRYNANVKRERGIDADFERANPKTATGLQIGGGLASGGVLLRAAPGAANYLFGNIGGSMGARMAAGGAAGAAQGAVHGFGEGEGDLTQRLPAAARGMIVGAPVGAAAAPIASAAGWGIEGMRNYLASRGAAADLGVSRGAVNRVGASMDADKLNPTSAAQTAQELGPEGMVLDMGRQLRGRGEAVAAMPGAGQNTILDAVETRVKETAPRIGQELDAELGRSPNIVELAKRIDSVYGAQIRPAYQSVMQAHPQVWDDTLADLSRRPSVQRAMQDAVSLARETGDDITSPFVKAADGSLSLKPGATPNLAFWDYVKKSLDSRIGAMARNPDPDSAGKVNVSSLIDTKRALLDHLDNLTGGQYAKARNIAADKFAVKEALDTGLHLFENKLLPEQFGETLSLMGIVERHAVEAGARRALERMREVAPANMSEGGRQVYRELLQGGHDGDTAQKLSMVLGHDAVDRVLNAAKRETGFQSVYDTIAGNSATARRTAAIQDMQPSETPNMSVTGLVNKLPALPAQALATYVKDQGSQRTREGIAELLTAKGPARDRVVQTLTDLSDRRTANASPAVRDSFAGLLQSIAPQQGNRQRIPFLESLRNR